MKRWLSAPHELGESGAVWQQGSYSLCMCQQCLVLGGIRYMHPAVCTFACRLALLCSGHTFSQHPAFACVDRGSVVGWCRCVWLYQHVDSFLRLCTSPGFMCMYR